MKRKDIMQRVASLIGIQAAHMVLRELTNMPESIQHLDKEIENYQESQSRLSEVTWNANEINKIKELAGKKCNRKLSKYTDIPDTKYKKANDVLKTLLEQI